MRNFTIGSIADIPIRLNATLLVFLPILAILLSNPEQTDAYAGIVESLTGRSIDVSALHAAPTRYLVGAAGAVGLFASVLVHELGHSWAARRFDVDIASITLWIFGGMAHMEELPEDWNVEFWIAVAGPITSLLLAAAGYAALFAVPSGAPLAAFALGWFAVVNLSLAVFNMLPAFPMDGGRVLRALLARSRSYVSATQTAASVGRWFAVLLAAFGLLVVFAPMMVLVAMFVYVAATTEARTTVIRDLLRGVVVRDLLAKSDDAVSPDATVQEAIERIVAGRAAAVPVVDGGRIVGLATLEGATEVPPGERDGRRVAEIMLEDPPVLAPDDDAFDALRAFGERRADRIVVAENGRVRGVLSRADLLSAIQTIQGVGDVSRPELAPDGYA